MGVYFGEIDRSVYFIVNENWWIKKQKKSDTIHHPSFCQTPVLGVGPGVDFTFTWDNKYNDMTRMTITTLT